MSPRPLTLLIIASLSCAAAWSKDAQPAEALDLPDETLLAIPRVGISFEKILPKSDGARLLDGDTRSGWRSPEPFDPAEPVEFVLVPSEPSEPVSSLLVKSGHWRPGSALPKTIEVAAKDDSGPFQTVGRFRLEQRPGWYRLRFPSVTPNKLMVRVVSVHGPGHPGLGELMLLAPDVEPAPETSTAQVEQPPDRFSAVLVNREKGNLGLTVGLHTYRLLQKFGETDAGPDTQLLMLKGYFKGHHPTKGTSVPDLEKAFFLRIDGKTTVHAHPLNKKTPNPFWGPVVIQPGTEKPFTVVFEIPKPTPNEVSFRHLSNQGAINLLAIGVPTKVPENFLAGPASKGVVKLAVESISNRNTFRAETAPPGWRFLEVKTWFTNLQELQPLNTDFVERSVIVEKGLYVFPMVSEPNPTPGLKGFNFLAGEPTPGQLVALVPNDLEAPELVYFTEQGALRLRLDPRAPLTPSPKPAAGPVGERLFTISLYEPEPLLDPEKNPGVVLDLGLQLNLDNPLAGFLMKPMQTLELHDPNGRVYKPVVAEGALRRPLRTTELRRDQVVRGQVAFAGVRELNGLTLVVPFSAGPTRLSVPANLLVASGGATVARNETSGTKNTPATKNPLGGFSDLFNSVSKTKPVMPEKTDISSAPTPEPVTASTEPEKAGTPAEMLTKAFADNGHTRVMAVFTDPTTVSLVGIVENGEAKKQAAELALNQEGITKVNDHILAIPSNVFHPRVVKKSAIALFTAANLMDIDVRMRKREEIILIGKVKSEEEEQTALAIARLLPGVEKVVNLLKKP